MNQNNIGRSLLLTTLSLLTLIFLTVWLLVISLPAGELVIKIFDVGQGDSIFIRTPAGFTILVDGGPNNRVVEYLDQELPLWDRRLDAIILTHPQADHLSGLVEVVRRFKVNKVFVSGVENTTNNYKLWEKTLEDKKISPVIVTSSNTLNLSDTVKLAFLWPKEQSPKVADLNEASIVMKLSYGNFDALLTGDADQKVQPYTSSLTGIEVLKVPHHGSKTAMSQDFINSVSPELSIISAGVKNRYGHPAIETLKQLQKIKSKVLRTDRNGTIKIVSNGETWYTLTDK